MNAQTARLIASESAPKVAEKDLTEQLDCILGKVEEVSRSGKTRLLVDWLGGEKWWRETWWFPGWFRRPSQRLQLVISALRKQGFEVRVDCPSADLEVRW